MVGAGDAGHDFEQPAIAAPISPDAVDLELGRLSLMSAAVVQGTSQGQLTKTTPDAGTRT
jgi:hypothetical protein